jgi:hypothetical protein
MSCDELPRGLMLADRVCQSEVSDDLVDATLRQPGGHRHVVAAKAVAYRPSVHQFIALAEAARDPVVRRAELAHRGGLTLDRDAVNWVGRPEVVVGEEFVAVRSHSRKIDYSSATPTALDAFRCAETCWTSE